MLVDELGGKAVTCVLLGGLDVQVDLPLRLEPLVAARIRAGEGAQTSVIQHVKLESKVPSIGRRTARMGTGELRRLRSVLRCDMSLESAKPCKGCSTFFAEVRSQSQVDCIIVLLKVGLVRKGQPTGRALERLLLEVDCALMTLQGGLS